jgi:hypothetical protein
MTHSRASTGRLCAALDFHPAQSPERSPLHDVRQHAPGRTRPGAKSLLLDEPRAARGNAVETEESSRARCRKGRGRKGRGRKGRGRKDRRQDVCSDLTASKRDRRSGGARRDRTDDLLLAKQALSQLSYGPSGAQTTDSGDGWRRTNDFAVCRVYSVVCIPSCVFRRVYSVARILSSGNWWAWEDLNFRPHAYQARALTS